MFIRRQSLSLSLLPSFKRQHFIAWYCSILSGRRRSVIELYAPRNIVGKKNLQQKMLFWWGLNGH